MWKLVLILLALACVAMGVTVAPGVKKPWVLGVIAIVCGAVALVITVFIDSGPILQ